ncbi:hypothetical protein NKH77_23290 [Streptomyces sp. M19]
MISGVYEDYFQVDKYDDYNMKKQGKGMFWTAVINPARQDEPEAMSCDKLPFWVDENETPDEPLAVSPKILAEYAYDELPVPDTDITMSPDGKQTVNLDTWVWLNRSTFKPVSVRASLRAPACRPPPPRPRGPHSRTRDQGRRSAPASGECGIGKDGSIGTPYADGKSSRHRPAASPTSAPRTAPARTR